MPRRVGRPPIALTALATLVVACSEGGAALDASLDAQASGDAAAGDVGTPPGDAGTTPEDAGATPSDTGVVGPDAAPGDTGTSTSGPCAGLACRARIDTDAEFEALSRASPEGGCQFDRELWIVLAESATSPLQDTYYVDAGAHPQVIDFVRALGPRYAALDVEQYFRAFEREDTREQRVGRIRRLLPVVGQPHRYAFDLFESEYFAVRSPTAADIQAVLDQLGRTFALPLGYAPALWGAIRAAERITNPAFALHLPALCPGETCAAGAGPCLVLPTDGELCGRFIDNRPVAEERAHQMRVQLAAGAHRLERGGRVALIAGGAYGPGRAAVVPGEPGRVITQDVGGLTYWSVEQTATVGGQPVVLRVDLPVSGPGLVLRDPFIDFTVMYASIAAGMPGEAAAHLSSCAATTLPRYYAEADLGGGDRLRLEYRYSAPAGGSGPLLPTRADVVLGGERRTVTDAFGLVYAGVHHNWDNQFQIYFDAPITLRGRAVHGLWIDEPGTTCCPVDSIRTLDAQGQVIETLTTVSYARAPRLF